ncbi:DEAD/DEAH box helicase domain protein [Alkaliphilus metalliredigens QYMF]|uniref:DEAD/DEAH box helicase domain protein n=2 Tax=Alkaliphilus TaxID=114627 RepID=A6TTG0_ALKMQ|nr:DEAD/DEAH box helicase domain protein [Alkaliphilus metalliredigens QYMF]
MKNKFAKLGISEEIENVLNKSDITEPTPVQLQAIPPLLAQRDVMAQAQTGTGKTLAFILPILERVNVEKPTIQALIITPTRELAIQITAETKKLAEVKGINILAAYGGQDVEQQLRKLKGSIHIIIGTPGRLLDHLRRKTINLGKLSMLVLDEADQMLHMGFLRDVEDIMTHIPKRRQNMFFSATMPNQVRTLAEQYMKDPVQIQVQSKRVTLDEIRQVVIETTDRGKQDLLCQLFDEYNPFMAIIFCRTKRRAIALNEALINLGYNSDELHGDLTQAKREKVMKAFKKSKIQYLVATDVAARGLDIEGVTHIFNYDIPQDGESYIHRIGRTGRAGETGMAITFMTSRDRDELKIIEKVIKMDLDVQKSKSGKIDLDEEEQDTKKSPKGRGNDKSKDFKKGKYGDKKGKPGDKKGRPGDKRDRPTDKKGRPGDKRDRPSDNKGRPGDKRDRPSDNKGRPGDNKGRPGDNKGRPGDNKGRPGDNKGRPGDNKGRPGDNKGRPGDNKGRPGDNKGRPGDNKGRPGDNKESGYKGNKNTRGNQSSSNNKRSR